WHEQPPLHRGHRVNGEYEVLEHLRRGGMADIYKVQKVGKNQRVGKDTALALKLLPFQCLSDRSMVHRFRREAAQARGLNHPSITRVIDYGEDLADHYLVMELAPGWHVDGRTALDVGELRKPLPLSEALAIARQACKGLAYVHSKGIIHRD